MQHAFVHLLQQHRGHFVHGQRVSDSGDCEKDSLEMADVVVQRAKPAQQLRELAAEDHLISRQHGVVDQTLKKFVAQDLGAEGDHEERRLLLIRLGMPVPPSIQKDQALKNSGLSAAGQGMNDVHWCVRPADCVQDGPLLVIDDLKAVRQVEFPTCVKHAPQDVL
jgi:hypothetical protein